MKIERPQFELTRVYEDGTKDAPEIIPVQRLPWDTGMDRRGFLGVGVGVASLLLLLDGKATAQNTSGQQPSASSAEQNINLNAPVKVPDKVLQAHRDPVLALAISPDGKTLASGSMDNTLKLWSMPGGKLLATLEGHNKSVYAVVISPDGKTLASGSGDSSIKLWSMPGGKLLATLDGHNKSVYALAISPDGKTLASGSGDSSIKLWSMPGGKLLTTLAGHNKSVYALAISPDGKTLASGSDDESIKLWSMPDGKLLATLEGHKRIVKALAISHDGKTLASVDNYGVIILWDLEKRSFQSFLFDPKVNQLDAIAYNVYDKITGQTITYTLPCGSPIPPGAVCTCNCVSGTYRPLRGGGGGCMCNKVCTCIPVPSDYNVKEAFETTDPLLILQRLLEMPIQKWNYKWDDASIRHIGPMAQDFAAAFAVGEDDRHIHPVDAQGVAFAAIQGLYRMMKEKELQTETLRAQLQQQQEENKVLKTRIEALERVVKDALAKHY